MARQDKRVATPAELKALAHPVRIRILRLCYQQPRTNQELAQLLNLAPGSVLRHVKTLLDAGLLVSEETRQGPRGVTERPYRATGLSWHLSLEAGQPELTRRVEVAALDAYREELLAAGPDATVGRARLTLRLTPTARQELADRIEALIDEYLQRQRADGGDPVNLYWSMHVQPEQ